MNCYKGDYMETYASSGAISDTYCTKDSPCEWAMEKGNKNCSWLNEANRFNIDLFDGDQEWKNADGND
jgi:hypothetical protein